MIRRAVLAAFLATTASALCAPAIAGETVVSAGALTIRHAWTRPAIPNRPMAGYFEVTNAGETAERLLRAESAGFGRLELHTTEEQDGVMTMRELDEIAIGAGETVSLAPGGLHVMLFDPDTLPGEGDTVSIELIFETAGTVSLDLAVRRRPPEGAEAGEAHGGHEHSGHSGHDHSGQDHSGHADHSEHNDHSGHATTN
ncbi:MAG: copper chaperone PCu(A)C [Pseudomonadota bacterium]